MNWSTNARCVCIYVRVYPFEYIITQLLLHVQDVTQD